LPTSSYSSGKVSPRRGFVEGRNLAIEYRFAEGQYHRLPALAMDFVRRQVAVIVATPTPAALAAKTATATVPIIFNVPGDPIKLGLTASFTRPDGNATGVSFLLSELGGKQLGLLGELLPAASRFGLLINPMNANAPAVSADLKAAAATINVEVTIIEASDGRAIETAFTAFASQAVHALVIGTDPLFYTRRVQLATLATRHGPPAIYNVRASMPKPAA